ncbi:methylated-DNA--[protein]-cysteine S-methyltransferase [Acidithiobacillus sp. AMEEHan]|uniref:methylated-DNA--[protein]-cysteine S-methyltransferase n=1 Tax=Acidithiobacillus sp. AMEEHan TaxID=2994951 RepID=UPI0027E41C38|nr:methylated-DNA--[protein]-cysteine S-methyltransferase [Acidithiobacillus sp. AMEEHan]
MDSSSGFSAPAPGIVSRWRHSVAPIGTLTLEFCDAALIGLSPVLGQAEELPDLRADHPVAQALAAYAAADFQEYERCCRLLLLRVTGTPFQRQVWRALQEIPLGQVCSYGDLARRLQNAPRAVGQACRRNPVAILIPCHRVLAKDSLGGYAGERKGAALAYKELLLRHEGVGNAHA